MEMKNFLRASAFGASILAAAAPGFAQSRSAGRLGHVNFPTSAKTEQGQADFIRGVLLLHSFEYPEAATAFREAQKAEPGFAMAYWGEAMTSNHPIWNERDAGAARAVLERLGPTPEQRLAKAPTDREKGYLRAVETLYAEGDKPGRDKTYAEEMRKLHEQFPKDDEASCFYALALLGTCEGERNVPIYEQAAAIAEEVFARRPDHPGAAHYLIHSDDDPAHAEKALPAARAYSKIAPAAPHALHMPSHIFLALGMWDEVISSNEASWKASGKTGYHALSWLQYAQLQEGRFDDARRTLKEIVDAATKDKSVRVREHLAAMRAAQIVETGGTDAEAVGIVVDSEGLPPPAIATNLFATGFARARAGDVVSARRSLQALERVVRAFPQERVPRILSEELHAEIFAARGEKEASLFKTLGRSSAEADALPYGFGPPDPVKPIHELWGDVALQFSRNEEARDQYRLALERAPRRRLSLEGLRKAEERLKTAAAK
jgi:tetratricopeptide (TPR) repeat protein